MIQEITNETTNTNLTTDVNYPIVIKQVQQFTIHDDDLISILSNISALLYHTLPEVNWLGFYLLKSSGDTLYLGPFQGKVACSRIKVGSGVCGTAIVQNQIQVVADVHQFPGHIACDSTTNSELVLPIYYKGQILGVLDIDSQIFNRFREVDVQALTTIAQIISTGISKLASSNLYYLTNHST